MIYVRTRLQLYNIIILVQITIVLTDYWDDCKWTYIIRRVMLQKNIELMYSNIPMSNTIYYLYID